MRSRSLGFVPLIAAVALMLAPGAAWAVEGEHSDNMSYVNTLG